MHFQPVSCSPSRRPCHSHALYGSAMMMIDTQQRCSAEQLSLHPIVLTYMPSRAGHLPFEGRNKDEIKHAISAGIMRPFPQAMSPACISFVSAMMIRDTQQRPSAKQLLQHPIVLTYLRTLAPAQLASPAPLASVSASTSDSASSLNGSNAMPRPLFAIKRPSQGAVQACSFVSSQDRGQSI